jgi:hypothetical protein
MLCSLGWDSGETPDGAAQCVTVAGVVRLEVLLKALHEGLG